MKLWKGSTVFIIGGGPSINITDVESIKGNRVIGVNSAYIHFPWIDATWFGDGSFYKWNCAALLKWGGIKATCARRPVREKPAGYMLLPKNHKRYAGLTAEAGKVSWNGNSGASAINFAYHMGAARVVLLGYDMKPDANGFNNYHVLHKRKNKSTPESNPYGEWFKNFKAIAKDAESLGLEIINATPDTALDVFTKMKLEELV